MQIFIDCGHGPHNGAGGAFDPGAQAFGTSEYAICSRLLQNKEAAFADLDYAVIRTPELSIQEVVAWINQRAKPGDILLSFHLNDGPPKASGSAAVYSYAACPERKDQAERIASFVASELQIPSRGALLDSDTPHGKPKASGKQGLPMLRDSKPAAFIVELGFISNKKELERIQKKGSIAVAELIRAIGQKGLLGGR